MGDIILSGSGPGGGGGGGGPVTIADGADVTEGHIADAAVQGDNPGTISAKLRGLNKSIAAGLPVTVADGADVVEGSTTDAAIVTDVNGTVSGKLRGLVKLIASSTDINLGHFKVDASSAIVPIAAANGQIVVEGSTADAAVQGDNPGTISAKLRGLNKSIAAGLAVTNPFLNANLSDILGDLNSIQSNQTSGFQRTLIVDVSDNIIGNTDRDFYTSGFSKGFPAFGVYDDTLPGLAQGMMGAPSMTNHRALHVQLWNAVGNATAPNANQNSLAVATLLNGTGGTIASNNQAVTYDSIIDGASYATAVFNIEDSGGPWVGTITFQGQTAGSLTWIPVNAVNRATGAIGTQTTANGIFLVDMTGVVAVRALGSPWTSGTAQVGLRVSDQPAVSTHMTALPAGTNVIGHVIVDTLPAITFASPQHTIVDSGSINVGTVTTLPAITFASPQHIIADASTAVIGHVIVDTAPSTPVTNIGLTDLDATIGTDGGAVPTKTLLVGGETNDGSPVLEPLPLGPAGRTIIVEGFAGGVAVPTSISGIAPIGATVVSTDGLDLGYLLGSTGKALTQTNNGELSVAPNNSELIGVIEQMASEIAQLKTVMQFAYGINL